MKFLKQSRETVPRTLGAVACAAILPLKKVLRIVWVVLFVPPPEQERIEEARIRASEFSSHFRKHGGG